MTHDNTYVVITTGNHTVTDFWPFSRKRISKQFLDLLGTGQSLLQITYERSKSICSQDHIYVVVEKEYCSLVKEQLPTLSHHQLLVEPVRRGTATGLAYAAHKICQQNSDALMVITPADHAIFGEIAFVRDIQRAVSAIEDEPSKLLIVGIKPTKPATNYRYIQYHDGKKSPVKKVKTLTDKPQAELARLFINSGDFVWNTDIYAWHVRTFLQAFEEHLPDTFENLAEGTDHYYTDQEEAFVAKAYSHCKSASLGVGILEKAEQVYTLLGSFDWSDISSWNALFNIKDKDEDTNIVEANALVFDSKGSYIKSENDQLIVVHSLDDYLVANSEDVLLICPKNMAEGLKKIVSEAKEKKGEQYG